jgi:hypothetical protein
VREPDPPVVQSKQVAQAFQSLPSVSRRKFHNRSCSVYIDHIQSIVVMIHMGRSHTAQTNRR